MLPGASLRPEIGADGKPTGKFLAGELSREEKGAAIIASMSPSKQAEFDKLVQRIKNAEPNAKVVPIDSIASTKRTIAELTAEFGDKAFKPKLTKLLMDALEKKGMKAADAAAAAKKAVDDLLGHEIMVVKGTDQLRAYGYRPRFISATGQVVEDDLHHMVWLIGWLLASRQIGDLPQLGLAPALLQLTGGVVLGAALLSRIRDSRSRILALVALALFGALAIVTTLAERSLLATDDVAAAGSRRLLRDGAVAASSIALAVYMAMYRRGCGTEPVPRAVVER